MLARILLPVLILVLCTRGSSAESFVQTNFDDFNYPNVTELDKKWGLYESTGTAGVGWFRKSSISVSGGILTITGKGDVGGGLSQNVNQTYGKWEIRARVENGQDYRPCIVIWPDSNKWPLEGEIDIMESFGSTNKFWTTLHYGKDWENHKQYGPIPAKWAGDATDGFPLDLSKWHTFACEWGPTYVRTYVDGVKVLDTVNRPVSKWQKVPLEAIPQKSMHLAIQLDVPESASKRRNSPVVKMQVDWVKVYERRITSNYSLTVNGGLGDGTYPTGTSVKISADLPPAGKIFDRWTGATVANPTTAKTTLTMPAANTTVTATYKNAPIVGPFVNSFMLVNADTDTDIMALSSGQTLSLASLPTRNLSLRANTSGTVGSVRFSLDGNLNFRTENSVPYAIAGDSSGNYNAWTPSVGSHMLSAVAYSTSNGGGTAGPASTIQFNVVEQAPFEPSIEKVSTQKTYLTTKAVVGAMQYIDRSYILTSLSAELKNGILIRQANNDKYASIASHITVSISAPAKVYVCYDKRSSRLPAWLNDGSWSLTAFSLASTDTAASPMRVYVKQFSAGTFSLGANLQTPASGALTNYIPIVQPLAPDSRELDSAFETNWASLMDTDGDGLSDEYELGVGLNPTMVDSNSNGTLDEDEIWSDSGLTHFQREAALLTGQTPGSTEVFSLLRIAGKLDFVKPDRDSMSILGSVELPPRFDPSTEIQINIGGATSSVRLNSKGQGRSATISVQLKVKKKRDPVTKEQVFSGGPVLVSAKMKGSFANALLTTDVADSDSVPVEIAVQIGATTFTTSTDLEIKRNPGISAKLK